MKGKGTAALVLALMGNKKKPMEGEDEEESDEGGMSEAKLAAAEEALAAIKADDAKAFSDALESFIECCGDE